MVVSIDKFTTVRMYDKVKYNLNKDTFVTTNLVHSVDDPAQVDITDLGTSTELNMTWTLADIVLWETSMVFDNPEDRFQLTLTIGSDFTETNAVTINFYWGRVSGDFWYNAVIVVWSCAGYIPLA